MNINDNKVILQRLRQFRLDEDLTYPQLAHLIKAMTGSPISVSALQVLCSGNSDNNPHERTLHRIKKFLKKMGALE